MTNAKMGDLIQMNKEFCNNPNCKHTLRNGKEQIICPEKDCKCKKLKEDALTADPAQK